VLRIQISLILIQQMIRIWIHNTAMQLVNIRLYTQHQISAWGRESEEENERKKKECRTEKVQRLKFVLRFCLLCFFTSFQ